MSFFFFLAIVSVLTDDLSSPCKPQKAQVHSEERHSVLQYNFPFSMISRTKSSILNIFFLVVNQPYDGDGEDKDKDKKRICGGPNQLALTSTSFDSTVVTEEDYGSL